MSSSANTVKVWDPLVRFGHWLLVIAFFTAYFTEDEWLTAHVWAGYLVGAIVLIRVAWGFVGTRHARFADFLYAPREILAYLRGLFTGTAGNYVGHNPAAGAMVIALLLTLSATVLTGLQLYAIEENAGPLAAFVETTPVSTGETGAPQRRHEEDDDDDDRSAGGRRHEESDREEFWEELHEAFTNLMLLLIALHLSGVVLSSLRHRENLVRAMITGRKRQLPH